MSESKIKTAAVAESGVSGFFSTVGRLPNTWLVLAMTVVAGLAEGAGIALFIPILEIMQGADAEPSAIYQGIARAYEFLGIPFGLIPALCGVIVLVLISLSLSYLQRHLSISSRIEYGRRLRGRIVEALFHASWPVLATRAKGDVVNQLLVEQARVGAALEAQIVTLASLIQFTVLLAISASLSWQLVLVCVGFVLILVFLVRPLIRSQRRVGEDLSVATSTYGHQAVEYLGGARLVKVTGTESSVTERLRDIARGVFRLQREYELNIERLQFFLHAIPVLGIALMIATAHMLFGIEMSYLLVFLALIARMMPRISELQRGYQTYSGNLPAMTVIDRALAETEIAAEAIRDGEIECPVLEKGIRLEQVSFRYPDADSAALHDVSIDIPRNAMVALVGPSGAGKSTLVDIIAGLRHPDDGRILIDGTNLQDLRLKSWRRRIGYVTQDVIIFNDTLRNNLTFGHPDASEADVQQALSRAHLADLVATMPDGLETPLGEDGVRLSGGQKQRLALARALVGNPDLLLLDEATSALDNESERAVQNALESISSELTIILIAHRLSTVRNADTIYMLESGRVVESGDYDTLIRQQGRFAELHGLEAS